MPAGRRLSGAGEIAFQAADRAAAWSTRALKSHYAIAAFDALAVKIRERDGARVGMLLFCLGIEADGAKDILGVWGKDDDGADRWRKPLRDLRRRGVERIAIVQGDFDSDLSAHVNIAYGTALKMEPVAQLMRRSLSLASIGRRKAVAAGLKPVLRAQDAADARNRLAAFAATPMGVRHGEIVALWGSRWRWLSPLFETPVAARPFFETFDAAASLKEKFARRDARLPLCFRSLDGAVDSTASSLINVATGWKVAPKLWSAPRNYIGALSACTPRATA